MAKKRMINTSFWTDGFIVQLTPIERYVFLYFLTNGHTEACGAYELPMVVASRELELPESKVIEILEKIGDRIVHFEGWVILKNFRKHQCQNPNMEKGAERTLKKLPDNIMAKYREIVNGSKQFETVSNPSTLKLKLKLKPKPKHPPEGGEGGDFFKKFPLQGKGASYARESDSNINTSAGGASSVGDIASGLIQHLCPNKQ